MVLPFCTQTPSNRDAAEPINASEFRLGYAGLKLGEANFVLLLEFPFGRQQRGSRNPRPPDPLAFWRRYSA